MNHNVTISNEAQHYDQRVSRRPSPSTVDIDKIYKERTTKGNYKWFFHKRQYDELKSYKGKQVLDIACGTGFLTVLLAKFGANVTSFDISPKSVEYAKELCRINGCADKVRIDVYDVTNLPYDADSFDLITGEDALHHIIKYKGSLESLYRILKPGGKVVFQEPFKFNPVINLLRWINIRVKKHEGECFIGRKELKYIKSVFDSCTIDDRCLFYTFCRFFCHKTSNFRKQLNLFLRRLDIIVLKVFPFLKCFYSLGYITMEKHKAEKIQKSN